MHFKLNIIKEYLTVKPPTADPALSKTSTVNCSMILIPVNWKKNIMASAIRNGSITGWPIKSRKVSCEKLLFNNLGAF